MSSFGVISLRRFLTLVVPKFLSCYENKSPAAAAAAWRQAAQMGCFLALLQRRVFCV
jgi:hypothetical protein